MTSDHAGAHATDSHTSAAMTGSHDSPDDHGGDHGHGHDAAALGPVDTWAWGAGALGILAGLVVAFVLAVSAGWFG